MPVHPDRQVRTYAAKCARHTTQKLCNVSSGRLMLSWSAVAVASGQANHLLHVSILPALAVSASNNNCGRFLDFRLSHGGFAQALALFRVPHHDKPPRLEIVTARRS